MPSLSPPLRRRRRGRGPARGGPLLLGLLWLTLGLIGLVSLLENYYQHRGFATIARPRGVSAGRTLSVDFSSPALGRQGHYLLYEPTGFTPRRRYPVLYLLHGEPGRPENFLKIAGLDARLDTLISRGQVPPMLLAMPDGRIHGSMFTDTEWADAGAGRYESFVLDVVHDVDRRFPTTATRAGRVLAGYSEGAFGAVNIALHHLGIFAGFQSWSGYFVENRYAAFAHASDAVIAANSPLDYAAGLASHVAHFPVRGFLYAGRADPDSRQLAPLTAALRADGADVRDAIYPGAHDWALWHAHATPMLRLAGAWFRRPPSLGRSNPLEARLAAARARRAAAAALALQRSQAILHSALLTVCRADVGGVLGTAGSLYVELPAAGRAVVEHQLVRNCELALFTRGVAAASVPRNLCDHLAGDLGLVRRALRRREQPIRTRCRRLVAPGVPLPALLAATVPATPIPLPPARPAPPGPGALGGPRRAPRHGR